MILHTAGRSERVCGRHVFTALTKNKRDLFLPVQLVVEARHVAGAGVRRAQQLKDESTKFQTRIINISHLKKGSLVKRGESGS